MRQTKTKNAEILPPRALNRALLARQMLLERAAMSPAAAIEHLVGMQAQVPTDPYFGLWSRLADFDPLALSALIKSRKAARIAVIPAKTGTQRRLAIKRRRGQAGNHP